MLAALKLLKSNLSFQLLVIVVCSLLFGHLLPESFQATFYSISLTLKEFLLFVLPAVIFSCTFACLLTFRGKAAIGFMVGLLALVCLSNFISTLIAYGVGMLNIKHLHLLTTHAVSVPVEELQALWTIHFPKWIPNQIALLLGFVVGSIFSVYPHPLAHKTSFQAKEVVTRFLEQVFVPLLPFFALGFILKMQHDGVLLSVLESYFSLIIIILCTYALYLTFLFGLAANFNPKKWARYLKNVVPVALTGFSTISSLATMPVTLSAAEKNTGDVDIARVVIPATVNIHMVGVTIAVPLMAFSLLLSAGHPLPHFTDYCLMAYNLIIAQFAVAGIPGGGILVMLPTLETHLGFTAEMSALITALYILFDPAITITNVLGNSALVIFVAKLFKRLSPKTVPA
jgi:Na+/H+-dicarboxylate symporter